MVNVSGWHQCLNDNSTMNKTVSHLLKSLAATLLLMTNIVAPTALLEAITGENGLPQCLHSVSVKEVLKRQYTSVMKVGTGGNLDLRREYHK